MKQFPELQPAIQEGAISVAEEAYRWCIYSSWHPAYNTRAHRLAWRDYKDKIPMADVYFAWGMVMPKLKHGMAPPEDP